MTPNQGNDQPVGRLSASVPPSWEVAVNKIRARRNEQSPGIEPPPKSEVIRDAFELYFGVLKATDELPEESRENLQEVDAEEVLAEHGLTELFGTDETEADT